MFDKFWCIAVTLAQHRAVKILSNLTAAVPFLGRSMIAQDRNFLYLVKCFATSRNINNSDDFIFRLDARALWLQMPNCIHNQIRYFCNYYKGDFTKCTPNGNKVVLSLEYDKFIGGAMRPHKLNFVWIENQLQLLYFSIAGALGHHYLHWCDGVARVSYKTIRGRVEASVLDGVVQEVITHSYAFTHYNILANDGSYKSFFEDFRDHPEAEQHNAETKIAIKKLRETKMTQCEEKDSSCTLRGKRWTLFEMIDKVLTGFE